MHAAMQVLMSSLQALLEVLRPAPEPSKQPGSPAVSKTTNKGQACVFTVQVVLAKSGPVKMVPAPGEHRVRPHSCLCS